MPKRYKHSLSRYANQFGQKNLSTLEPEFEFHLGHVERVFPSESERNKYPEASNMGEGGDHSSPSQMIVISPTFGLLPSKPKYAVARPLLRGFSDSITRGDLVLYTNINGKNFYLGPLNTTNQPNYTPDHTYRTPKESFPVIDQPGGYSSLYPKYPFPKLEKTPLDMTLTMNFDTLQKPEESYLKEGSELSLLTKHTDLTLEGRHGNSIRIGSRREKPSINISNGRVTHPFESGADGSNISLFSVGSLSQNLGRYTMTLPLSCDWVDPKQNPRELQINYGNNPDLGQNPALHEDKFYYDYGDPTSEYYLDDTSDQIIMFSDRITFDAKRNDLTFSAYRNINLGAGKNFTLTNRGFSVIETNNIYLGKEAKKRAEPMVLGSELKTLLINILEWLKGAHAMTQAGPQPLVDVSMAPFNASKLSGFSLDDILEELNKEYNPQYDDENKLPIADRATGGPNFFSNYHFIEPNWRPEQTEES